ADQFDWHYTRRLAALQGSVDVEADERHVAHGRHGVHPRLRRGSGGPKVAPDCGSWYLWRRFATRVRASPIVRTSVTESPLEAARKLAPQIRASADEIDRLRELPRAVVANTPAATGKAIVVPGGYRVTADRQGFSTGCRHATWVAAHAQVIENGKTRLEADGTPELRYLLVPVGEAELLDTWHTRGM